MDRHCIVFCLLGLSLPASAMDLKQAWDLLQYQGPIYRAAVHEKAAGEENRAIGKAGLLPQVNASAYDNKVNGTQRQNGLDRDLDYDSKGANVRLRQPLFNKQKMAEYRQGKQRADYSVAVFDAKSQDAAVRLAESYFDVLLASETILLAKSKLNAFEEQLASAKRRMELGAGTITDIDESVARRDLAEAELIEAQDNLVNARRKLEEYIGEPPESLTTLQPNFATPPLLPSNLQDWLVKAQADSPLIHARRHSSALAEEEVKRAKAGHWPTLDFVAGYTAGDSQSISELNQRNRYSSIGLEVNFPLYSGGGTSALARQASANSYKAMDELDATRQEVITGTTREYQGVQSGAQRIHALEKAVASNERSLASTRKGFKEGGTSTNSDVLNAEELLFVARHDLFEAKLRYLMSRLRLASSVGSLGDDDIDHINNYLGPELLVTN
ncbi:TolC family outer membrane protein [Pseudomonas umsongensis]|jgi:protease secretion system outer membrane protein|uniref:Channel protein TolC n=2 Tax=Pseudomonas umsongensis TaxID=198618 RepID=A0AAE6ZV23_9PSED|nr:TolC family outer membrane protein [Pseudomonas umsongensis]KEX92857.1 channel protein TolC [Pseudomonas putida]MBT9575325.1 TolC family outer membrane protein [Pseudomonas umsongensis]OXR28159.1 channel protein TolC [Pseudomonas umsongensis]QFG29114.1 TolC family outer membrane protein [Pseudomonas umsongensis]QJC78654.1 TolC family outer membrane protein [Pseudomonas umsongensis]